MLSFDASGIRSGGILHSHGGSAGTIPVEAGSPVIRSTLHATVLVSSPHRQYSIITDSSDTFVTSMTNSTGSHGSASGVSIVTVVKTLGGRVYDTVIRHTSAQQYESEHAIHVPSMDIPP